MTPHAWYRVEMLSWELGIALHVVLLILSWRAGWHRHRPFMFFWLVVDVVFDVTLYSVNLAGGYRTTYPRLWEIFVPIDALFMGTAALEQMQVVEADILLIGTLGVLVAIALPVFMLLPHIAHSAELEFCAVVMCAGVVGMLISAGDKDWVLVVYMSIQAAQHIAVLRHSGRWHAGALAGVGGMLCFMLWVWQLVWSREGQVRSTAVPGVEVGEPLDIYVQGKLKQMTVREAREAARDAQAVQDMQTAQDSQVQVQVQTQVQSQSQAAHAAGTSTHGTDV